MITNIGLLIKEAGQDDLGHNALLGALAISTPGVYLTGRSLAHDYGLARDLDNARQHLDHMKYVHEDFLPRIQKVKEEGLRQYQNMNSEMYADAAEKSRYNKFLQENAEQLARIKAERAAVVKSFKPKFRSSAILKTMKDTGMLRNAKHIAGWGIAAPLATYWGLGGFDKPEE